MDPFKEIAGKIMAKISGKDEPMSEMPKPGAPLQLDEEAFLADAKPGGIVAVPKTDVTHTLAERGSRYGKFSDNSRIFADLMGTFRNSPAWREGRIDMIHEHALSNIATKLARLLTGDPDYDDNWRDIAGYATLMVSILNGEEQ